MLKHNIVELSESSIDSVSGASSDIDWGAVGTGAALVGVGIAIAATPVGWVGAAGATLFSFSGGLSIGGGAGGFLRRQVAASISKEN